MSLYTLAGLSPPFVLSITGAGGKTSLLRTLAEELKTATIPHIISTTTKMGLEQLAVYGLHLFPQQDPAPLAALSAQLADTGCASLIGSKCGQKATGLSAEQVDWLHQLLPTISLILEADGARRKHLKAPADYEPVIPACTTHTAGVLNLSLLDCPANDQNVHRLEQLLALLSIPAGTALTLEHYCQLAIHPHGLFQYARGRKLLFLTGVNAHHRQAAVYLAQRLSYLPQAPSVIIAVDDWHHPWRVPS